MIPSTKRAVRGVIAATACMAASGAMAQTSPSDSTVARVEKQPYTPAAPAKTSYPSAAAGYGATANGYNPARWVEDWSRMRDPQQRRDFLDRLKYLPLVSDEVYLTLSGELRGRVNYTEHFQLSGDAQRQDIYRIFGGADLHLGKHVRLYGELARGVIEGKNIGTPSGSFRNDLFVQQRFIDINDRFAGLDFGLRYGRQIFIDGPNLLVSTRDNNTVQFTVNGTRAWLSSGRLRADFFDFDFNKLGNEGTHDDEIDEDRRFSGVTTGTCLPTSWFGSSKLYLEPFLWRQRQRAVAWGDVRQREERYYGGARLWGDVGPLAIDWTVDHQWGDYGDRKIDAWQFLIAQSWRLGNDAGAPRIGAHFDYASGGGAYDGGTLGNASTPYGNNIYYAYGLFLTPTNLIALAPNFSFAPLRDLRVTLEYQMTWREDKDDAIYRSNGTAYVGTPGSGGSKTGDVARLQAVWTITPRLSFTTRLEHLSAGDGLRDNGYRSSNFAAALVNYRF